MDARGNAAKPSGLSASKYSEDIAPKPTPYTIPHRNPSYNPASPIIPTRNTAARTTPVFLLDPSNPQSARQLCHYYITPRKECRFTDEECPDLHMMEEDAERHYQLYDTDIHDSKINKKSSINKQYACHYWATQGKDCSYSAAQCKYAHHWTGKVARPPGTLSKWKRSRWGGDTQSTWGGDDEDLTSSAGDAQTVVEDEVENRSAGWW
jgi:hypothetical protein